MVILFTRHAPTNKKRDPRVSWFIWVGLEPLSLQDVWPPYRRRYGQEHGFRFEKQDLLWLEPHFRTPEQFQRWTDVMAAAQNQLALARPLTEACRYPWEASDRAGTPQPVSAAEGR